METRKSCHAQGAKRIAASQMKGSRLRRRDSHPDSQIQRNSSPRINPSESSFSNSSLHGTMSSRREKYMLDTSKLQIGPRICRTPSGNLFRCFHRLTGESFTAKVLDEDDAEGHQRELHILQSLDHPNLVRFLGNQVRKEHGEERQEFYFEPQLLGGRLLDILHGKGALAPSLIFRFGRDICSGLLHMHERRILHNDLRAACISIDLSGVCKISDFSCSKLHNQSMIFEDHTVKMWSNIAWKAPELLRTGQVDFPCDIWSFGACLLEMAGHTPWAGTEDPKFSLLCRILNADAGPPIPESVPLELCQVIRRCFYIQPEERPSARRLLRLLS